MAYAEAVSSLADPLERLEGAFRDQGAAIADLLAPGASDEHLDQIAERLGYPVPPELRAWWAWHDGVLPAAVPNPSGSDRTIGPGFRFLSSTEAVDERDRWRAMTTGIPDPHLGWEDGWPLDWLPVLVMDSYVKFIDQRQVTPVGTAPVRIKSQMPDDVFTPLTGSLRQSVAVWTYMLEAGHWRWDRPLQGWDFDVRYAGVPLPLRWMD